MYTIDLYHIYYLQVYIIWKRSRKTIIIYLFMMNSMNYCSRSIRKVCHDKDRTYNKLETIKENTSPYNLLKSICRYLHKCINTLSIY